MVPFTPRLWLSFHRHPSAQAPHLLLPGHTTELTGWVSSFWVLTQKIINNFLFLLPSVFSFRSCLEVCTTFSFLLWAPPPLPTPRGWLPVSIAKAHLSLFNMRLHQAAAKRLRSLALLFFSQILIKWSLSFLPRFFLFFFLVLLFTRLRTQKEIPVSLGTSTITHYTLVSHRFLKSSYKPHPPPGTGQGHLSWWPSCPASPTRPFRPLPVSSLS